MIDEARFRGEIPFAEPTQENLDLLVTFMFRIANLGEFAATRAINLV